MRTTHDPAFSRPDRYPARRPEQPPPYSARVSTNHSPVACVCCGAPTHDRKQIDVRFVLPDAALALPDNWDGDGTERDLAAPCPLTRRRIW